MNKWRYISGYNLSDEQLNDAGELGWELVSVCQISGDAVFHFKRPIE